MTANRFRDADWEELHKDIQKRLRFLADEICATVPAAKPRFSKTVTEFIPLFSYVSFRRPLVDEGEYIIVGVNVIPVDDQWRIDADIADEEEGTIFFELPNASFAVSSFDELRKRVLDTTDELVAYGKSLLLQLCVSSVTPPRMPFDSTASIAEDRRR
jgi:hypothetical protein